MSLKYPAVRLTVRLSHRFRGRWKLLVPTNSVYLVIKYSLDRAPLTVIADNVSLHDEKLSSRNNKHGEKNHNNTYNFVVN
jgi:hypothetical protein